MEYAIEWQAKKQPPRPEESSNLTYSGQSYASSHGAVSICTHKVAQGQQPITLVQMQHTAQQEFQHNNDQKLNRNSGENNNNCGVKPPSSALRHSLHHRQPPPKNAPSQLTQQQR